MMNKNIIKQYKNTTITSLSITKTLLNAQESGKTW